MPRTHVVAVTDEVARRARDLVRSLAEAMLEWLNGYTPPNALVANALGVRRNTLHGLISASDLTNSQCIDAVTRALEMRDFLERRYAVDEECVSARR